MLIKACFEPWERNFVKPLERNIAKDLTFISPNTNHTLDAFASSSLKAGGITTGAGKDTERTGFACPQREACNAHVFGGVDEAKWFSVLADVVAWHDGLVGWSLLNL